MRLRTVTLAERPRALAALRRIQRAVWPANMAYINEDAVCGRLWPQLLRRFPEFQVALCDPRGRVVAGGYSIPFVWDGRDGQGRMLGSGLYFLRIDSAAGSLAARLVRTR